MIFFVVLYLPQGNGKKGIQLQKDEQKNKGHQIHDNTSTVLDDESVYALTQNVDEKEVNLQF